MNCILTITNILILLQGLKLAEAKYNEHQSTLLFRFMITRHGARTPIFNIPGDPNNNYWHEGLGQLTNVGKTQLQQIGEKTRLQSRGFLNKLYKPEEITVRSTQTDRTIMSAQCFLAGLYPPKDTQVWNPSLDWQPIPVYLVDDDSTLGISAIQALSEFCPPGIQNDKFYQQYKDIIDVVQVATGIQYTKCMDVNFFILLDSLTVEKFYNLSLPFGLDSKYGDIKKLKDAAMVRFFAGPELIRAQNGPLFKHITDALNKKRNNTISQKAYAYFMHDANVLSFLAAMTNYSLTSPSFGASITIELHETANSLTNFNVKVYYTSTPTSTPELQYIKDCGYACPLKDFTKHLDNVMNPPPSTPICPCSY